jgi:formylglycine-generating enzyme required for sulfatase activity
MGAAVALGVWGWRRLRDDTSASCGPGFYAVDARCLARACPSCPPGRCSLTSDCPQPLVCTEYQTCDAPLERVEVPAQDFQLSTSDWEAEGKVAARRVQTAPFRIDRFEISVGRAACPSCPARDDQLFAHGDHARAMLLTREAAARICASWGGRLPTEDEWLAVATQAGAKRYPWGDTGATCRRAAWALVAGPCGAGATGPDTVGAHPDGASPLRVEDLAGNVAEWVLDPAAPNRGVVRGGHYASAFAAELRGWRSVEVDPDTSPGWVGARCVYDAVR